MQRPLRFVSVIVPIAIAACSDAGDGDLFGGSKDLSVGGSASGSTAGLSGGLTSSNGGSVASSGSKSAATGGAPSTEGGRAGGGTAGVAGPLGGSFNGGGGGSNPSSGGSKASSGGTASGGVAMGGGGPGASGGATATGGSQTASGGSVASGGGPFATGGSPTRDDCQQARAALSDALELAQACNPGSGKQCLGFIAGECCPVAVNDPDSEAAANFTAARAKWEKACGGAVCLAALCVEPTTAVCQSGLGSSRCVAGPSFSL